MTKKDARAFAACMTTLSIAYSVELRREHGDVYFKALQDYEIAFIQAAIEQLIRTSKWLPKPAEIREAAAYFRAEARQRQQPLSAQKALMAAEQAADAGEAIEDDRRALTAEEAAAFLAQLHALLDVAPAPAPIPKKGADALVDDVRRLDAIGARDMTPEKQRALESFQRYEEENPR